MNPVVHHPTSYTVTVDLLNRYSKNSYQGLRIHKAAELAQKLPDGEERTVPQLPPEIRLDRRLSDETVSALVQAYQDGTSTTQLRSQFNLSQGSVIRILHQHGVTMRGQGMAVKDVQIAAELYQDGATLAQLSDRFSVSPNAVRRALVAAGVVMRGRGRRSPRN